MSTGQQQTFAAQQLSTKDRLDSTAAMSDHFYVVDDDYEQTQKDVDFPSAPLSKGPTRQGSRNNLRIHTYPKSSLHERYMSSEEEPSPSPDSETESRSGEDEDQDRHQEGDESQQKAAEKSTDEPVDIVEYRAETAIAIPIMAIGRPKLVDITNLAPMHKRKRSLEKSPLSRTATKNAAARGHGAVDGENGENMALPQSKKPALSTSSSVERLPRRQDSVPDMHAYVAPDSWLPSSETDNDTASESVSTIPEDDGEIELEETPEIVEGEHYFPTLELRKPLTYNDYDPYSLNPPRLSPRNSYNTRESPANAPPLLTRKPGSITRARKQANAPNPLLRRSSGRPSLPRNSGSYSNQQSRAPRIGNKGTGGSFATSSTSSQQASSWKGLTRSLSMAKKQEAMHPSAVAAARDARRGPRMQARGANEREELPTIPPFPFEGAKTGTSLDEEEEDEEEGVTAAEALKNML